MRCSRWESWPAPTAKYDQALQYFQQILSRNRRKALNPKFHSEVYYQIALTLQAMNKTPLAEQYFHKTIQTAPHSFSSYQARIELAPLLAAKGQTEQALQLLQEVIRDRTDELAARAQFTMGKVYQLSQQPTQALTNYLRVKYVYKAFPEWVARALLEAAKIYEKQGKKADARKLYTEITRDYSREAVAAEAQQRLQALQ